MSWPMYANVNFACPKSNFKFQWFGLAKHLEIFNLLYEPLNDSMGPIGDHLVRKITPQFTLQCVVLHQVRVASCTFFLVPLRLAVDPPQKKSLCDQKNCGC